MTKKDCQTPCQLRCNDYDRFCRLTELKVRRGEYISSEAFQWQSSQIGSGWDQTPICKQWPTEKIQALRGKI